MSHKCHAIGCTVAVPPRMLMCYPHWRKVPKEMQRIIYGLYVPGQETTKTPTDAYLFAQAIVVGTVAMITGVWVEPEFKAHVKAVVEYIGGIEAVNDLPEEHRAVLRPILPRL